MQKNSISIRVGPECREVRFEFDMTKYTQRNMYELMHNQGWCRRQYEVEVVRALENVLKPGDTFIDVGAHVGYFSMVAAAIVGTMGRVIAFEPENENFDALHETARLNCVYGIIQIFRNAAGASDGQRNFWVNRDNDGGNALWDVGLHEFNQSSRQSPLLVPVIQVKLDSVVAGPVHAIKIDTEGAELEVLKGAAEVLKANPSCAVICEINRFGLLQMGTSEEELRTFMEELGYKCFLLPPDSDHSPIEMEVGKTIQSDAVFNVMFRK